MLHWLLYQKLFLGYAKQYPVFRPLRLFDFITFRTAFASLTALFLCIVLGPWLIQKLREFQIGQHIREEGPQSHKKKAGTPPWAAS
jgi:UDP-N-acetylmuramyl pentapeptide phosphotransferase/UDP-N-acetylglucosamine-1-phosphate transferase